MCIRSKQVQNITVEDILVATRGILLCGSKDTVLTDICINSNEIKEGDLFVPIIGQKVDAHKFISNALEKCAATITSKHTGIVISEKPYIYVHDTTVALQNIGEYIRNRYTIPVIAVTGSVGKTTTREMISNALGRCVNVFHTEGNQNSQIGVPITLSKMNEEAKVAVLELGMSEKGQMDTLSRMVKPDISVITVIGVAHIEYLKTKENIRTEKLAITNGMNEDGILFLNGDDEMLVDAHKNLKVKTFYYGTSSWCDYKALNIRVENNRTLYDYVHNDKRIEIELNVLGRHNVSNSLVAMAIADLMNYDLDEVKKSFSEFTGQRQKIITSPGKYTIIDDTYNASPDSMKASIDVLCDINTEGKRVAVLGDMFELGENARKYHIELGEYISSKKIDELIVIGDLSQNIMEAVKRTQSNIKCYTFNEKEEIALYIMAILKPEDVVLIKGSNGMKLNEIVNLIK